MIAMCKESVEMLLDKAKRPPTYHYTAAKTVGI